MCACGQASASFLLWLQRADIEHPSRVLQGAEPARSCRCALASASRVTSSTCTRKFARQHRFLGGGMCLSLSRHCRARCAKMSMQPVCSSLPHFGCEPVHLWLMRPFFASDIAQSQGAYRSLVPYHTGSCGAPKRVVHQCMLWRAGCATDARPYCAAVSVTVGSTHGSAYANHACLAVQLERCWHKLRGCIVSVGGPSTKSSACEESDGPHRRCIRRPDWRPGPGPPAVVASIDFCTACAVDWQTASRSSAELVMIAASSSSAGALPANVLAATEPLPYVLPAPVPETACCKWQIGNEALHATACVDFALGHSSAKLVDCDLGVTEHP